MPEPRELDPVAAGLIRASVHFAPHGLGFPGGEALRFGRFGGAGLPGDRAAGCALAATGVLPGLLVQQLQSAPGRWPAVHGLVLAAQPVQLAGDRDRAGAEQVHDLLADPADLGAVAVRPGHHRIAEGGQLGYILKDACVPLPAAPFSWDALAAGSPWSPGLSCRWRTRRYGAG